jgi:hypothetical protein
VAKSSKIYAVKIHTGFYEEDAKKYGASTTAALRDAAGQHRDAGRKENRKSSLPTSLR